MRMKFCFLTFSKAKNKPRAGSQGIGARSVFHVGFLLFLTLATGVAQSATTVPEARYARLSRGIALTGWFQYGQDAAVSLSEIQSLKQSGFTHVRLPFDPDLLDPTLASSASMASLLTRMDAAIDMLISQGILVVLDAHSNDGGMRLNTASNIPNFVRMWSTLSARYANRSPELLMFELMNEPGNFTVEYWNSIQVTTIAAIREFSPAHTIVVTPTAYSSVSTLIATPLLSDANVIYTFHYYNPLTFTHQGADYITFAPWMKELAGLEYPAYLPSVSAKLNSASGPAHDAIENYIDENWNAKTIAREFNAAGGWARNNDVKVWMGEFGAKLQGSGANATPVPVDSRARWIRDVRVAAEKNGFGWTMWNYKQDFGLVDTRSGTNRFIEPVAVALGIMPGSIVEAPAPVHIAGFSKKYTTYSDAQIIAADPTPGPGYAEGVALVDFSGTGNSDLIATRINYPPNEDRSIEFLVNNGNGNYSNGAVLFQGTLPKVRFVSNIVVADFNQTTRNSFFLAEQGSPGSAGGQSRLIMYGIDGKYYDATANLPQQIRSTLNADAADVDNRGPSLILFNQGPGQTVQFLANDGTGRFTIENTRLNTIFTSTANLNVFTAGKFVNIGRGYTDLVLLGNAFASNYVVFNDGSGNFQQYKVLPPKPFNDSAYAQSIEADDLNDDGLADLVIAYIDGSTFRESAIQILINLGNGEFRDETNIRMPKSKFEQNIRKIYFAPIAGTNRNDLLVQLVGANPIIKKFNAGVFVDIDPKDSPNTQLNWNAIPADIDNDGSIDIVAPSQSGNAIAVFNDKWVNIIPTALQSGIYYNLNQPGHITAVEFVGNRWILTDFLFEVDGRPTWKFAAGFSSAKSRGSLQTLKYVNGKPVSVTLTTAPIQMSFSKEDTLDNFNVSVGYTSKRNRRLVSAYGEGTKTQGSPETGWWWNPNEPGRAYFMETQGDTLFMVVFGYNAAGQPTWVYSAGPINGKLYEGQVVQIRDGVVMDGVNKNPSPAEFVGKITGTFTSPSTAVLSVPGNPELHLMRLRF